jgi:hypothetical protein
MLVALSFVCDFILYSSQCNTLHLSCQEYVRSRLNMLVCCNCIARITIDIEANGELCACSCWTLFRLDVMDLKLLSLEDVLTGFLFKAQQVTHASHRDRRCCVRR